MYIARMVVEGVGGVCGDVDRDEACEVPVFQLVFQRGREDESEHELMKGVVVDIFRECDGRVLLVFEWYVGRFKWSAQFVQSQRASALHPLLHTVPLVSRMPSLFYSLLRLTYIVYYTPFVLHSSKATSARCSQSTCRSFELDCRILG